MRGIVGLLAPEFPRVYVTQTASDRALPAQDLARVFEECGKRPDAVFSSVREATDALAGTSYVACGSITTAGEVAALLRPGVQNAAGHVRPRVAPDHHPRVQIFDDAANDGRN